MTNKHEWISGDGVTEPKCQHECLEDDDDDDKWLEPEGDAHVALTKVILDTRFLHNIYRYVNFRYSVFFNSNKVQPQRLLLMISLSLS